jgi:S-DNA-T family DNA segregation ATPase FtsK/SpoIIIE
MAETEKKSGSGAEQPARTGTEAQGRVDEDYLEDAAVHARLQRLRGTLPPWLNEIVALLLVVFGLVSLLILVELSTSEAWLAQSWKDTLRQLFGPPGAVLVSLGVVTVGLLVLLPTVGVSVRGRWQRILAIEATFAAFLALLHLLSPDPLDPRALAEVGLGGGYVGWALSQAVRNIVGQATAVLFWGLVFVGALAVALGVRRRGVRAALGWLSERAWRLAQGIETVPPSGVPVEEEASARRSSESRPREPHVKLRSPGPPGERRSIVPRDHGGLFSRAARSHRTRRKTEASFTAEDYRDRRKVRKRGPRLPPLDLLDDREIFRPKEKEISANARIIEATLADFAIQVEVIGVKVGPTVIQYAVQPFKEMEDEEGNHYLQRVRVRKIASLAGDLALALSARRLRIQAPVPGTSYVGVEVPNQRPSLVALRPVLESKAFYKVNAPLALPLGRDVSGAPVVTNLATMPHLLIAGTTGSGKSVAITAMTTALVMNNTPDDLRLIMLDPKMVELVRFNGLPHLLGPVETDLERIIGVLRWATREMDRRYAVLEAAAARNIETYNKSLARRQAAERLPYIVIFMDEIGDLMMSMPDETEQTLCRLAQMARAVGIHLVVATQRPSVDVITGLIKANFPARISFAVPSGVDSRVILDTVGAESLLGSGDMLFLAPDAAGPQRVQGCFVSDVEIERVVSYWEEQQQTAVEAGEAEEPDMAPWERGLTRRELLAETDSMLEQAIQLVVGEGRASVSLIQRRLGVGYPRAARIMDFLEELGITSGPETGGRTRRVLIRPGHDTFHQLVDRRARAKSRNRPST